MNSDKKSKKANKQSKALSKQEKKEVKAIAKQAIKGEIDTKTINVPDPISAVNNTANRLYLQGSGLQYLAVDVFKVSPGVQNSSLIGGTNRIGDRAKGLGFLMDYFFHSRTNYGIATSTYHIPFVKVRVTVFEQAFQVALPVVSTLYDANMLTGAGASLRPVDLTRGNARKTLYDKLHIIYNKSADPLSANPNSVVPVNNVWHFRKYIKYNKILRYMDNNSINPDGTQNPIYISVNAEVDDSFSGLIPTGTTLLYMTGRTQAWFKDV